MSTEENLKAKFNEISGGSEFVSREQLLKYLTEDVQENKALISKADFDQVFDKIDTNKDGKVSFEEFSLFSAFCRKESSKLFTQLAPLFIVVKHQKELVVNMDEADISFGVTFGSENFNKDHVKSSFCTMIANKNHANFASLNHLPIPEPSICFLFHDVENQQ